MDKELSKVSSCSINSFDTELETTNIPPEKMPSVVISNALSNELLELLESSLSPATRKALKSDIMVFFRHAREYPIFPASEITVAEFIAKMAKTRTVSTITRYVSSISKIHDLAGHPNPCRSELVRTAMSGLRRSKTAVLKQAHALRGKELMLILKNLSSTEWSSRRNRAIFALGWSAALRLSELCAINIDDLEIDEQGIVLTIRKSKTDQTGESAKIGIPKSELANIVTSWRDAVRRLYGAENGPLWPKIGAASKDRWFPSVGARKRLSIRGMSQVIKRVFEANKLRGSSHSLRRGMISEAAAAGVPELVIQRHSRHKSIKVLRSYVEEGNIMIDNPLPAVFDRLFRLE